jgi:hypothetical protein
MFPGPVRPFFCERMRERCELAVCGRGQLGQDCSPLDTEGAGRRWFHGRGALGSPDLARRASSWR